jgi:hypothetical protein
MTLWLSISSILSNVFNIFVNLFPTLIAFFKRTSAIAMATLLLLPLRHTNISLSKYVNMLLLLLVLVAMENQIMKHLLGSGTNQPMERINIMSPLRFFLHMPRLGRNLAMFELLETLHQTRWSLHLRVMIFLQPPHPIARIFDWFCSLYTTLKRHQ